MFAVRAGSPRQHHRDKSADTAPVVHGPSFHNRPAPSLRGSNKGTDEHGRKIDGRTLPRNAHDEIRVLDGYRRAISPSRYTLVSSVVHARRDRRA